MRVASHDAEFRKSRSEPERELCTVYPRIDLRLLGQERFELARRELGYVAKNFSHAPQSGRVQSVGVALQGRARPWREPAHYAAPAMRAAFPPAASNASARPRRTLSRT